MLNQKGLVNSRGFTMVELLVTLVPHPLIKVINVCYS